MYWSAECVLKACIIHAIADCLSHQSGNRIPETGGVREGESILRIERARSAACNLRSHRITQMLRAGCTRERVLRSKFVCLHLSWLRALFMLFVSRPAAIRLVIHHGGVHAFDAWKISCDHSIRPFRIPKRVTERAHYFTDRYLFSVGFWPLVALTNCCRAGGIAALDLSPSELLINDYDATTDALSRCSQTSTCQPTLEPSELCCCPSVSFGHIYYSVY
jgi:hypothetical protein